MNAPLPDNAPPETTPGAAISELHVEGMTCNNCARHVTEAIQSVAGVRSASISLTANHASVRWQPDAEENTPAVVSAIKAAGYEARPAASADPRRRVSRRENWHLNLWLGGVVTGALMLGEWLFHLGLEQWFQWLAFGLASVVQVFCGAQFYRGAWRQLKIGSSNMDTLVALGSTTAFGYSTWALLAGTNHHLYFMEAAAIITLISVGHWIEARVSERASGALKSLLELAPQTARRLGGSVSGLARPNPSFNPLTAKFTSTAPMAQPVETEVPVGDLRSGDLVALRPGDRVPVDGLVTEGNSAVDESMLTGESKPVDKSLRAELYAGTVNLNGRLVMRVTKTGEATALANIIAAVQRAQTSRANIQRLGDRVSNVFVPIVVTIALAAGLWWGMAQESALKVFTALAPYLWTAHPPNGTAAGFIIAAAVLIIACPCAMGLATPAAIMASANAAAKRGILIRDGVALEKAGTITAIVFDKTGTLTEGRPKVVATQILKTELDPSLSDLAVEDLAAALASLSSHPLSKAVSAQSGARYPFKDFHEYSGRGISALFGRDAGNAHLLQLGSLQWLKSEQIETEGAARFADEWMSRGATVIGLAANCRLVASFALRDTLKPAAKEVVRSFGNSYMPEDMGIYIISGDSGRTVHAIAEELGIHQCTRSAVYAEVKPEQKAEFIKKLQAQGERVAFVGDGINDAPALTQADLGIAVSRASDVAREAADIILLKSEIEAVPEALGLARATLRTIKQNLFWAFFYNAVGIPLAALGFMSPVLCAAAMGFSDLIVIGNALRLRRWKLPG